MEQKSQSQNQPPKKPFILEYIWLDSEKKFRSKTRVLNSLEGGIPVWNYDGSSTNQAEVNNSEIILIPGAIFPDPFRGGKESVLVLCSTYTSREQKPTQTNGRHQAVEFFKEQDELEMWFGLEQEFFIMKKGVDGVDGILGYDHHKTQGIFMKSSQNLNSCNSPLFCGCNFPSIC